MKPLLTVTAASFLYILDAGDFTPSQAVDRKRFFKR